MNFHRKNHRVSIASAVGGLVLLAPLDLARRAQVAELAVVAALAATGVVEPGNGRRAHRAGSESERPKVSCGVLKAS